MLVPLHSLSPTEDPVLLTEFCKEPLRAWVVEIMVSIMNNKLGHLVGWVQNDGVNGFWVQHVTAMQSTSNSNQPQLVIIFRS